MMMEVPSKPNHCMIPWFHRKVLSWLYCARADAVLKQVKHPRKFLHAELLLSVCESAQGIASVYDWFIERNASGFTCSHRSKMAAPILLNLRIVESIIFQMDASDKTPIKVWRRTDQNMGLCLLF